MGLPGADEIRPRYLEGKSPCLAYEVREPRDSRTGPGLGVSNYALTHIRYHLLKNALFERLVPLLFPAQLDTVRRDSRTAGELPTLLYIHGNTSHRGVWYPVVGRLADYRSVLLDLRGHGDSDHVEPPAYNSADHAADLARVVRELELSRYALVGHSNGTLVAARFARLFAGNDDIPAPAAFIWLDMDPLVPDWQVQYFRDRAGAAGRVLPSVEAAMARIQRLYPKMPEELLRAFVQMGLAPAEGGWRMKFDPATCASWDPGDGREDLPGIRCPSLVVRGSESMVSSEEGLAELETGLADVEIRKLPGSHMLVLEHPREVAAAIDEFLRRRTAAEVF